MARLRVCNGCGKLYNAKITQCPNEKCEYLRVSTKKVFWPGYGGSPWATALRQNKMDFRVEDMGENIESYK